MIFSKPKHKLKATQAVISKPKPFLVWLEIGVTDMNRAIRFYQNVFRVEVEIRYLFDKKSASFLKTMSV